MVSSLLESICENRGYSHHILASLKRIPGAILANGISVPVNILLHEGDVLTIHLSECTSPSDILPVYMDLSVLYEDQDLMIINKPADMPVHPSIHNHENTLANAIAWRCQQQNLPFVYRCINRLDRDTSGLLITRQSCPERFYPVHLPEKQKYTAHLSCYCGRISLPRRCN